MTVANEFMVSRVPASISGPESIHFLTNLKRTLSIAEATRLRDYLTGLLGDAPKSVKSGPDPEREKLKAFLMANYKSETGNETPEACAIRLLTKKK